MSFITAAVIGGSALLGAYSSNRAAKTQAGAANRAADLQQQQFERQVELQEPWRQAGVNALGKLQGLSDYKPFGMEQFQADPGYGFRLSQGTKALERSAAARGGLISGNTGGALQNYGQGLASQEYQNAFNRYGEERNRMLNPLQTLAGVGQTATNQLGAAGQNYATGAGSAYGAAGQALASGYMGGANAVAGGVGQYMNYQQGTNLINALNQGRMSPSTGGGNYGYIRGGSTFGEGEY